MLTEPRIATAQYSQYKINRSLVAALSVLLLAVVIWVADLRGLDYPAQIYRMGLIRRHGFSLWDANWYDGHYTPGYGVIVPWASAVVGLATIAIVSTVGSVVLLDRLLVRAGVPRPTLGSTTFGFLMLVNMYEGRLPFACGVLLGLASVMAAVHRRWQAATIAGILTALASPVAGAFLALAAAAWALSLPRASWRELLGKPQLLLAVGPLVTTAALSLFFLEGGMFPFNFADVAIVMASSLVAWLALPASYPAVRYAFALTGVLALPLMVIPNPMGGNLSRLAVVGAPILCSLPIRSVVLHAAVCVTLLVQQAEPLLRLPASIEDPSAQRTYFQPLLEELRSRTTGAVRLEIPTTLHHWEAAFVAPTFPLARGWERQLDLRYNQLLYEPTLNEAAYQDWLFDNGVTYVALPDAPLEEPSEHESALVQSAPYLDEVWHNEHWRLYHVTGSPGLVSGPARVMKMAADVVRLEVTQPGSIVLRMRFTRHLVVVHGSGCVAETPSGWTSIDAKKAGFMTLRASILAQQPAGCEPP